MTEIKQGYKQTDIGMIPMDWEVKTIGKLGLFSKGNGISRAESNTGIIPSVRYGEIYTTHNDYIKKFYSFISLEVANRAKKLKVGDILFTASGETKEDIGKNVAFIDDIEAYAGGDIIILSPKNANSLFLGYLFNAPYVAKQKANKGQGDAVVHITKDSLRDIVIAIPKSVSEQTAIATALSDTDALIAALDKKIAKKQQIKQGAMQQLLTGKKRLPGYSGEWVEKELGQLCNIFGRIGFRGYTKNDLVNKGSGAITFSPSDIHNNIVDLSNCTYISLKKYEESPEIKIFNGDIIFVKTASIGKCAIISSLNEKATINPQFVVFKNFKCNNYFLYSKLIHDDFQNLVLTITGGSTIPTMSQEKLSEIKLIVPKSIEEQTAIAQILTDMDNEIAQLEKEQDKYKELKAGMMQVLLTGKIRLI
jgi:type I restriction enzyme S subunit